MNILPRVKYFFLVLGIIGLLYFLVVRLAGTFQRGEVSSPFTGDLTSQQAVTPQRVLITKEEVKAGTILIGGTIYAFERDCEETSESLFSESTNSSAMTIWGHKFADSAVLYLFSSQSPWEHGNYFINPPHNTGTNAQFSTLTNFPNGNYFIQSNVPVRLSCTGIEAVSEALLETISQE